ncbi:MAG: polyprenol monophosphomannose synthase [Proteobacteria bacterium]|nr:polyprenol monophosphomannose synthase [Pseudomonadota bacterium]
MIQQPAVVIATYDERPNVERLLPALLKLHDRLRIVVVDDNSPDGTADAAEEIGHSWPDRVEVVRRPRKLGYGSAILAGLTRALELDPEPDCVVTMDADFSHDPQAVPQLLAGLEQYDLVIGSRYVGGIRILNWSLSRLLLSVWANRYVGTILRFGIGDCTSGFRAYRTELLRRIEFDRAGSNGYACLVEILEMATHAGVRVLEVPIVYEDRQHGRSKMDRSVIFEAAWKPWVLLLRRLRGKASDS